MVSVVSYIFFLGGRRIYVSTSYKIMTLDSSCTASLLPSMSGPAGTLEHVLPSVSTLRKVWSIRPLDTHLHRRTVTMMFSCSYDLRCKDGGVKAPHALRKMKSRVTDRGSKLYIDAYCLLSGGICSLDTRDLTHPRFSYFVSQKRRSMVLDACRDHHSF